MSSEIKMVVTERGREMISMLLSRHHAWVPEGYRLFHHSVWGEGGWKELNGIRVPKDPLQNIGNNNLDVILNPSNYPEESRYHSDDILIDLESELETKSDYSKTLTVSSVLPQIVENNDPFDDSNPLFWETGIFDNCGYMLDDPSLSNIVSDDTGYTVDNLIMYATFETVAKSETRSFNIDFNIPWII